MLNMCSCKQYVNIRFWDYHVLKQSSPTFPNWWPKGKGRSREMCMRAHTQMGTHTTAVPVFVCKRCLHGCASKPLVTVHMRRWVDSNCVTAAFALPHMHKWGRYCECGVRSHVHVLPAIPAGQQAAVWYRPTAHRLEIPVKVVPVQNRMWDTSNYKPCFPIQMWLCVLP